MQLVADEDAATGGHDGRGLVVELVERLEPTEIGPRLVESPGHAREGKPVHACLPAAIG